MYEFNDFNTRHDKYKSRGKLKIQNDIDQLPALVNKNWTRKIKKLDSQKGYLFHGPLDNETPAM